MERGAVSEGEYEEGEEKKREVQHNIVIARSSTPSWTLFYLFSLSVSAPKSYPDPKSNRPRTPRLQATAETIYYYQIFIIVYVYLSIQSFFPYVSLALSLSLSHTHISPRIFFSAYLVYLSYESPILIMADMRETRGSNVLFIYFLLLFERGSCICLPVYLSTVLSMNKTEQKT